MWPNPQFPVDLVTFTEEILMENFIFYAVAIIWFQVLLFLSEYKGMDFSCNLAIISKFRF